VLGGRGLGLVTIQHPDREHQPVVWAISEDALLAMLWRASAGEDPDEIYAEIYVNAKREHVDGDGPT
jgi:hypothetical protein